MQRRTFLRNLGAAAAGALAMPYILPGGRLFARTGSRRVDHVVFCLFAGGVRNIESVHQDLGNLMPGLLNGTASTAPGTINLPPSPWPRPLQQEGTLFPELRYAQGPTGHYNGHTVALTGVYTETGLNLAQNPDYPTVFEYYRKHTNPSTSALNAWWIANSLGPYPALNYSRYPGYGPAYGANHLTAPTLFSPRVLPFLTDPVSLNHASELRVQEMRNFLDANFRASGTNAPLGVVNTPEDAEQIRQWMDDLTNRLASGAITTPLGLPLNQINSDLANIYVAEEVLTTFRPELLVVNMQDVDICHQNFTDYVVNLQKADYAVAHLWNTIQTTPGLANNTVMLVMPEHGRNLQGNNLVDAYGRFALDHTNDATSREIFALVLGPPGVVRQNQVVGTPSTPQGESIDLVPTINWLLGYDTEVPAGILNGRPLEAAFV